MAAGYPATVDFRGKILPRFDGTYHYVYPNGDELSTFAIASVSGTVSQGAQITIDVSNNTYKRDGQLRFLTGDPAQLGADAVPYQAANSPGAANNYKHSSEDSFMGTGASLKAEMAVGSSGSQNPYFALDNVTEVFMSTMKKVIPITYGTDSPQMKCERITGPAPPDGDPMFLGTTYFWSGSNPGEIDYSYINLNPSSGQPWPTFNNPHTTFFAQNWVRTMMYLKASTTDAYDGSAFIARIDEATKEVFFGTGLPDSTSIHMNDPDRTGIIEPFWTPMNKHLTVDGTGPNAGVIDKAWIPNFMRSDSAMDVFVDGIYLNDSLERVEFGNASTYGACTKRVIQNQESRKIRYIDVECYMGDLSDTDDIYAFVFNADGSYTPGYLVRGALV